MDYSLREQFDAIQADCTVQRQPWEPHWEDVATYLSPYRLRLSTWDANRGERKNQKILNSSASLAHRTYKSGMTAHNTSSARPWFSLSVPDQDLAEYGPVKDFTDKATEVLLEAMGVGTIYKNYTTFYGDQAGFSNAALWLEEDLEEIAKSQVLLCGSYYWLNDDRGRVNISFRKLRMTVRNIIKKWGPKNGDPRKIDWSRFSSHIKTQWENNGKDTWVDLGHMVMPNPMWNENLIGAQYKRFLSCYYELGTCQTGTGYLQSGSDYERMISQSGYDHFPVLAGRGEVAGDDTYGIDGPGMLVIGDIRELQYHTRKEGKAIDKVLDPPLTGPPELKGKEIWGVPGKFTPLAERDGQKGLRPIYQVDPRIDHLLARSERIEHRIDEAFFVDFWRMLSRQSVSDREMTATEIIKRSEEQVAQLEPTISSNNAEVHGPLIDFYFDCALRQDRLPPIPKELQGQRLNVVYRSSMAMAMRSMGLGAVDRVTAFTLNVAEKYPNVGDKVNWDHAVDEVASRAGAPARMIVPDEVVQKIRADRAQAQAQQAQSEQLERAAKGVESLANAKTGDKSALTDIVDAAKEGAAA